MNGLPADPASNPLDGEIALFLRMPAVMQITGLGRSTIYRLMAEDRFPTPVRVAKRAMAWRRTDLQQWSAGLAKTSY